MTEENGSIDHRVLCDGWLELRFVRASDGERLLVDALRVRRALERASRLFLERVFAMAQRESPSDADAQQPPKEAEGFESSASASASASKGESSQQQHNRHRHHQQTHHRHSQHNAERKARAEVRHAVEELGDLLEKFYSSHVPHLIRYTCGCTEVT